MPATPNFSEFGEDEPGPFINVHASSEKPAGAFIAIRYRSAWFWIDDGDYTSKKRFSILMGLFTVTESGDRGFRTDFDHTGRIGGYEMGVTMVRKAIPPGTIAQVPPEAR